MTDEEKQEQSEIMQSKGIDLHLLDPRTMTFEEVSAVYEKITGRKSTPEDDENARLLWEQLQVEKNNDVREPGHDRV